MAETITTEPSTTQASSERDALARALVRDLGLGTQYIQSLVEFTGLTQQHFDSLRRHGADLASACPDLIEEVTVYMEEHLSHISSQDDPLWQRVGHKQCQEMESMLLAPLDEGFVLRHLRMVLVHLELGIPLAGFLGVQKIFSKRFLKQASSLDLPKAEAEVLLHALVSILTVQRMIVTDAYGAMRERELLALRSDFVSIVEQTRHGKVVVGKDGCIRYANGATCTLLQLPLVQGGRTPFPHDYDLEKPTYVHQKSPTGAEQVLVLHAEGTEWQGHPATLVTIHDETERQDLQNRLLQMDRLSTMGTLAAGVGHEINNPLSYVVANLGYALELLDQYSLDNSTSGPHPRSSGAQSPKAAFPVGEFREILGDARDGTKRIRSVVNDLRIFGRSDAQEAQPTSIRSIVEPAISMAYNEIRHRARLVRDLGSPPKVHVQGKRLSQVILNLLINAAQSIPPGDAEHNHIRIRSELGEDSVALIVEDSGSGIPPELLPEVFEPFVTTKPPGEGTGLGLALCRQIVESNGGRIKLTSSPGAGTQVYVTLPIAKGESLDTIETPPISLPAPLNLRVLVIDDEPLVGKVIYRILKQECQVSLALGVNEALPLVFPEGDDQDSPFDVILCDLQMPDRSGVSFYREVQERAPDLLDRIIFLTGGAFTGDTQRFLEEIKPPSLKKPFDVRELRRVLRKNGIKSSSLTTLED